MTKFLSSKAVLVSTVFFTVVRLHGQTIDSTTHVKKEIFVSGGINLMQYSDAFFDFLLDNTPSINPVLGYGYRIDRGSPDPSRFNYSKSSLGGMVSGGLDFTSGQNKNLHHIMQISYLKFSGTSSYSDSYRKSAFIAKTSDWSDIVDTTQIHFSQTALSLGYKFQAVYKLFFFSIGANCFVNLIHINQQKQEQTDDWADPFGPAPAVHYGPENTVSNATSNVWFINVPLQLGAGRYIKLKKMVLKPAFYYSPCFMKGYNFLYNFYNVSIDILYTSRKT